MPAQIVDQIEQLTVFETDATYRDVSKPQPSITRLAPQTDAG